eukprot:1384345-Amorphochlora_amoeboformis.AAC.1
MKDGKRYKCCNSLWDTYILKCSSSSKGFIALRKAYDNLVTDDRAEHDTSWEPLLVTWVRDNWRKRYKGEVSEGDKVEGKERQLRFKTGGLR